MHYLDVRKKRSQNEFEEDIDRELEEKEKSIRDKEINPFWNSYFLKLASEVRIETEK